MRNMAAYKPAARVADVGSIGDVFRAEPSEEWVKTSVSLRRDTRRLAKTYAVEHDMKLQELIDRALTAYMEGGGGAA